VTTVPASLISYRQQLEAAIRGDLATRRARRRGTVIRFALAAAAASALALGLVKAVGPASAKSVVRRAAAAVDATPGTILHVDMTGTQRNPDGSTVNWRDESWQLESAPYSRRQIETGPDGSRVETTSGPAGEQVYDPAANTIYVGPRPETHAPPRLHLDRGPKPGAYTLRLGKFSRVISAKQAKALRKGTLRAGWTLRKRDGHARPGLTLIAASKLHRSSDSSDHSGPSPDPGSPAFRDQILALLNSGGAHVSGHRTIDGRKTIEISSPDGHTTYYVDPDSYEPVELDTTGTGGGVGLRFRTYQALPAEGNDGLLDLRAQHPHATVDRDASDYQSAQARLFPHG
jgi:hypothetical protein